MKIKLSKRNWESMGKKAGWMKVAGYENSKKYEAAIKQLIDEHLSDKSKPIDLRYAGAMGMLESIIADALCEIESAIDSGEVSSYRGSVERLGAGQIIEKINNLKEGKKEQSPMRGMPKPPKSPRDEMGAIMRNNKETI